LCFTWLELYLISDINEVIGWKDQVFALIKLTGVERSSLQKTAICQAER